MKSRQFSIRTFLALIAVAAIAVATYLVLAPKRTEKLSPEGYLLNATNELPACSIYWFRNADSEIVSGFVAFGDHSQLFISGEHGDIHVPSIESDRITIPRDGNLYVLDASLELHKTDLRVGDVAADWRYYENWSKNVNDEIAEHKWQ